MLSIKETIIERDGMSEREAEEQIAFVRKELNRRLIEEPENCYNICEEFFGLEPDYLFDLL